MFTAAQKNLPNPSWICLKCPQHRQALIKASLLRCLLFALLGPVPVDFATAGNGEGSRDLNNSSMPLLQNCDCQWAHPQHQRISLPTHFSMGLLWKVPADQQRTGSRKQLRQLWWPRAGGPNAWDCSTATCSFKTQFC